MLEVLIGYLMNYQKNPKRFENIKNQVKNKFDIKYISNMYLDIYKNLINDKKK